MDHERIHSNQVAICGRQGFTCDGAPRSFYGIENIEEEAEELTIVEGECDVIALASIGIKAVSCPNGAPIKVSCTAVSTLKRTKSLRLCGMSASDWIGAKRSFWRQTAMRLVRHWQRRLPVEWAGQSAGESSSPRAPRMQMMLLTSWEQRKHVESSTIPSRYRFVWRVWCQRVFGRGQRHLPERTWAWRLNWI